MCVEDIQLIQKIAKDHLIEIVLEHLNLTFYVIDKKGKYLFKNKILSNIIGEAVEFSQDIDPKAWEVNKSVITNKKQIVLEEKVGEKTYLSIKSPLFKDGEVIGVVGFSRDTSEISNLKDTLLEETRKNLKNEQLKNNIIRVISHEARGNAANFISIFDMMKSEKNELNEKLANLVNLGYRDAQKLISYIENIEKISSIGNDDVVSYSNNFYYFLVNYVNKKKVLIKNLILNVSNDYKELILCANYEAIEEILDLILSNSISYNSSEVEITITATFKDSTLDISVKDNGCGVTKEKLLAITNSVLFSDNDSDSNQFISPSFKLSYAKKLIEYNKGSLSISSILNKGFTVSFKMPACIDKDSVGYSSNEIPSCFNIDGESENNDMINSFSNYPISNLKILVVDDNELSLKIITNILKELGCEVVGAKTKLEVYKLIKSKKFFDVYILDVCLEDTSGIKLKQYIAAHTDQGFFIAYTSRASKKDVEKLYDKEFADVLIKPLSISNLKKCLIGVSLARAQAFKT